MTAYSCLCGGHNGRPWLALAADGTLWKHPAAANAASAAIVSPHGVSTTSVAAGPSAPVTRAATAPLPGAPGASASCAMSAPPPDSPHWEPILFNETYAGYYEPCHFTAIAVTKNDFVAAGLGPDGRPCAYRSLYGGVWDQVSLLGGNPVTGWVQPHGRINAILYDSSANQLFLLSSSGEVVTLPDCPKCVRIRQVSDQPIISGEIREDRLCLRLEDGSSLLVSMRDALQLRISYSYGRQCLAKASGGVVIWLGHQLPDFEKITGVPDVKNNFLNINLEIMTLENIREWLDDQPKDMFMAFWCDYGTQADEAAACARMLGYESAFSLGGARPMLHVD